MTVKFKPEQLKNENWNVISVNDGKNTPIQGVEAATEDTANQFIEEEATLLREYCEARSNLTIVGFLLYSKGVTNAEYGKKFSRKWGKKGVKVW